MQSGATATQACNHQLGSRVLKSNPLEQLASVDCRVLTRKQKARANHQVIRFMSFGLSHSLLTRPGNAIDVARNAIG
jgi:hypothetical protein